MSFFIYIIMIVDFFLIDANLILLCISLFYVVPSVSLWPIKEIFLLLLLFLLIIIIRIAMLIIYISYTLH